MAEPNAPPTSRPSLQPNTADVPTAYRFDGPHTGGSSPTSHDLSRSLPPETTVCSFSLGIVVLLETQDHDLESTPLT